jgi:hypothetical protein
LNTAQPEQAAARRGRLSRRVVLAGAALCTVAALGAGLFAATHAHSQHRNIATKPTPITVTAQPLPSFQPSDPQRREFGPLVFRGGLVLASPHPDFGGISSLQVKADGERFLAVTDRGMWLRGRIVYEGKTPVAVTQAEIAPILGADGRPITRQRRWYDAEGLAIDGDTVYVSLERVHQILAFDYGRHGLIARARPLRVPQEFRKLPSNQGIEALAIPRKGQPHAGSIIALSERALDGAGNIRGFLLTGRKHETFAIRRSDDFDITDAEITPGGDMLILERSFSLLRGVRMRIRRIPLRSIEPGAVVDGPVLIYADMGYQIDNMEGLSLHEDAGGELVLTLVSDDNFSSLQRTLLLQFALVEP